MYRHRDYMIKLHKLPRFAKMETKGFWIVFVDKLKD